VEIFFFKLRRQLLKKVCKVLGIQWHKFEVREHAYCTALFSILKAKEQKKKNKGWKYAKIGAAGIVSGVVIAFTGGLAAPVIGAGLLASGATGVAATAIWLGTYTGL